jgi:hypothetical protein
MIEKSTKILDFLRSKEINRKGFGLKVSSILIKTFVLSYLNYLYMESLPNEVIKKLKLWNNKSIQNTTGGNFRTSRNSMLILSNQTPLEIKLE